MGARSRASAIISFGLVDLMEALEASLEKRTAEAAKKSHSTQARPGAGRRPLRKAG